MGQTIEAVYEDGVLVPTQPLAGILQHSRVRVTVESAETAPHPLASCIGTLPNEDAQEMMRAISDEFERVDPDAWR